VHQVKLSVDVTLHTTWHHCVVTEDVVDGVVA
jgi:hypothetical protein